MAWGGRMLRDIMQAVVVGFYGYEATQKMLNYEAFAAWCRILPYIRELAPVVAFLVVAIELLIVVLVVLGRPRTGMLTALGGSVIFTVYHCMVLSADWFYLPFHPYWPGMTWLGRMALALTVGWICWWWLQRSSAGERKKEIQSN